ncbi:hypothetical protein J6590_052615 [Homalodisca vitripennis]|nr:hypothetical protein J6590_052615 [Homalodisca vitripennis]
MICSHLGTLQLTTQPGLLSKSLIKNDEPSRIVGLTRQVRNVGTVRDQSIAIAKAVLCQGCDDVMTFTKKAINAKIKVSLGDQSDNPSYASVLC